MTKQRYAEYYLRAIKEYEVGLKEALGPTGIGKTSEIEEVICSPLCQDRKCIYCANRKQLVEDVGKFPHCVVLHRDLEVVLLTLKNHRKAFYTLLEDEYLFINPIRRWNDRNPNRRIDFGEVRRACRAFEELLAENLVTVPPLLEEKMDEYARVILKAFKAALRGAKHKKKASPVHQKLLDHPVVQSLFPFIAFKQRPEIRLIAMTLQKGFYGFFDGEKTLNLTLLEEEDGGYIIFLDEFDFLENDLISLICRSPQIRDPFHMVELFYRAMREHKLPHEPYPQSKRIREDIEEIQKIVDDLRASGIDYPRINQFTSLLPQQMNAMSYRERRRAKASPVIFRTQHTISTNYLYVKQTIRSFEIFTEPILSGEPSRSALDLFDAVSSATQRIVWLFNRLKLADDEITYREMLRHCFENTIFPQEIELISHFSNTLIRKDDSELTSLLGEGFSLYDIYDLQQVTDDEEVEVRHFAIHITPENILCSLARNNLVFAMSATTDIKRHVHHFHLDWLHEYISVYGPNQEDKELVRELNTQKAAARDNHVALVVLDRLDENDSYQRGLLDFIEAVAKDEDFGNDTHEGHLKQRVERFFATILRMNHEKREQNTSLLFLNTFRQIQLIFDRYPLPEDGLFAVSKRANTPWFQVYDFTMQEKECILVFYNTRMGNIVRQNQPAQELLDSLFWEGKPVVVVTQYLSAGNGVNLQYWSGPDREKRLDFTHIGLLETPYFYFGKPEDALAWDDKIALLKENIWYQAKLYAGKVITEQRFLQMLSTLNDPWAWNGEYQESVSTRDDALLNNMATFMQALGRVERVWTAMSDQTVILSRDVYEQFQQFCKPEFAQLRREREPLISDNLRRILACICAQQPIHEQEVQDAKDSRLMSKSERSRQAVKGLLARLEHLRNGSGDSEARRHWLHLRQTALKHDFHDPILRGYDCVAESGYYHKGVLYLTPQNEIIPPRLARYDTIHWRMDSIYRTVKENQVICEHFLEKKYPLAFPPFGRQFLTPYCYQAIFTGALGEEAIAALLQDEGIALEEPPDPLFETVDQKICTRPFYIDSKFYNDQTLSRFALDKDDPLRHPKLNDEHFAESARLKVRKLKAYHGSHAKLIYINLSSHQPRPRDYYDHDFIPVSTFEQASIIVVQAALWRQKPNVYQQGFEHFLYDLRKSLLS